MPLPERVSTDNFEGVFSVVFEDESGVLEDEDDVDVNHFSGPPQRSSAARSGMVSSW
jgi:hypothetical protein